MSPSSLKKVQLALAQYLAASISRLYPASISLGIGTFPYGCFYDFAALNAQSQQLASLDVITHHMISNETAVRREMMAKNAASLFRAERKNHLAKKAELLGNKLIYVFQLHSFFCFLEEDFCLDLSKLHFTVKECIPRGTFSKREIPVFRIIAYTEGAKKNLQEFLESQNTSYTKLHCQIGEKMDLFHFRYEQNIENLVWTPQGSWIFFRLQQFFRYYQRMHHIILSDPYPIKKTANSYLSQLQRLPICFAHMYLSYNDTITYFSPFPNLYSLPLEMKDCSYEFCSHQSLQKRLEATHHLMENFYKFLQLPYFTKNIRSSTYYFYTSTLGSSLIIGYTSVSQLNKNISIIESSVIYSIERMMGILLENEDLPIWLHPRQVYIFYELSELPKIKKILVQKNITYHMEQIKKKNRQNKIKAKELNALYNIIFLKNGEIIISGQKNEARRVTFSELDTLLLELEKKNCPEKLIIG